MQQISATICAQIRQVELYTRRLLRGMLMGASRSGIKGLGFEFDQLREYQIGDDVRSIDWRSSARMQSILVKQYLEERNRTVILMVDVSSSMEYGLEEKYQKVAWVASVMALIGAHGSDKVGLVLYGDAVECYIPPSSGLAHARRIMQVLFEYVPKKCITNILVACKHIQKIKGSALVCVVSDFIDEGLDKAIKRITRQHELIAIRYLDGCERALPTAGVITMYDQETGRQGVVNLSTHSVALMKLLLQTRIADQNRLFKKHGVCVLDSLSQEQFIPDLVRLLRSRMRY